MKTKANQRYSDERRVIRLLGLTPAVSSGSRWQQRQDGECEHFMLQHKSTSGKALSIHALDIEALLTDAAVSRKLPVFVIEFVRNAITAQQETLPHTMVSIPVEMIDAFCMAWVAHKRDCQSKS